MSRLLIILERAYAGAIEEQYCNILWICWSHQKMGYHVGTVLRSNTVLYARRQQKTLDLAVGSVQVTNLFNYAENVSGLLADGGAVYVLRQDLDRFQLSPAELYPQVQVIDTADLATLCSEYDDIWYW